MPFRPCPSGCDRSLSADDGHDRCLQCLGFQHTEDAFVDDSCACCGRMSMISLQSRLSFMKGLAPSAATRAGLSASRGSPAGALGDLRVTVRALHSVWRHGSRCPACLAGSRAQFDSATRFSSPGELPSSTAFSRRRWQSGTPLSCARRLLSSWQRMQSSRSLQPR